MANKVRCPSCYSKKVDAYTFRYRDGQGERDEVLYSCNACGYQFEPQKAILEEENHDHRRQGE